jgi:hypothetical protein
MKLGQFLGINMKKEFWLVLGRFYGVISLFIKGTIKSHYQMDLVY